MSKISILGCGWLGLPLAKSLLKKKHELKTSTTSPEKMEKLENLGLNLGGYFTASQQFAKYFQKQGYGNIINISSIYIFLILKFNIQR